MSALNSPIRLLPLGGLGEIGMNCMVLEHEDEIIVIDCGLLFSDLDHFGIEFVIPDFTYLRDNKDKIKAFVITHGHEDHIGALAFALKAGIQAPVYASEFTSLLIRERLTEHQLDDRVDLRVFKMGDRIDFKHFKVTTASVNHSIVDSAALLIDTPYGKVIHTGDFKIDPTPYYGHMLDERVFRKAGDEGVLLLLSDSTNVERHTHSLSEKTIYQRFEQLFAGAEGMTIVSMFASNVARIGQVMELAHRLGKRVVLAGRGIETNVRLSATTGYLEYAPKVVIPADDFSKYPRKDLIVISTGSQAEQGSALTRISRGEHKQLRLEKGDLVLMSSRYIPGNEKAIGRMINDLFKQGAEVLYEAVHEIHASGHATRPELKQMLEWTRPRFFIPIHGEYRHLVHHAEVAREVGVKPENVLIATNGDIVEVSPDRCEIVGKLEEPRVLVEGREGNDVSKLVLKDRRQLAETGMAISLLIRDAGNGKIVYGPEIVAKGLTHEDREGWILDEAKDLVRKTIETYESERSKGNYGMDLQETIRVELRRFFKNNIGNKPVVLPIILDL